MVKSMQKNKKETNKVSPFKRVVFKTLSKFLICGLLFIAGLIAIKYNQDVKPIIHEQLYEKSFNLAYFNELYQKYLGDILPLDSLFKEEEPVFNEQLVYQETSIYKDGVKLTTSANYLVPALENGVVTFVGTKEDYGNTIIIQGADGVSIWYGNINQANVEIYDYVEQGEFLGEVADNTLYLIYEKDGVSLDYKDYLK